MKKRKKKGVPNIPEVPPIPDRKIYGLPGSRRSKRVDAVNIELSVSGLSRLDTLWIGILIGITVTVSCVILCKYLGWI